MSDPVSKLIAWVRDPCDPMTSELTDAAEAHYRKVVADLLSRCICRHDEGGNCLEWCAEHAALRDKLARLLLVLERIATDHDCDPREEARAVLEGKP